MAITLRKRSRSRPGDSPAPPHDDVAQAERTAMLALADTLQRLAAGLPGDSRLAGEFARVARSIDVAGVLGTWRLDTVAREFAVPAADTP